VVLDEGVGYMRFMLDPVAEFVAADVVVQEWGRDAVAWEALLDRMNAAGGVVVPTGFSLLPSESGSPLGRLRPYNPTRRSCCNARITDCIRGCTGPGNPADVLSVGYHYPERGMTMTGRYQ
jgi:hypothetical protein